MNLMLLNRRRTLDAKGLRKHKLRLVAKWRFLATKYTRLSDNRLCKQQKLNRL